MRFKVYSLIKGFWRLWVQGELLGFRSFWICAGVQARPVPEVPQNPARIEVSSFPNSEPFWLLQPSKMYKTPQSLQNLVAESQAVEAYSMKPDPAL